MLLIFDWDGTLCDSTGKIVDAMHCAAKEVGLPGLADHQVLNIIGLGLREALTTLYPNIQDDQAQALKLAYSRFFMASDASAPSQLYDGVEEVLTHLRDGGYQLALATGKSRQGLDRVLLNMGLAGFFHASRCADETCSKPDPTMLHELLMHFRMNARDAIMVGDTEYDMEMARRADIARVAVSYGAHHIERLLPYEPSLCIDRFHEFKPFVAAQLPLVKAQ